MKKKGFTLIELLAVIVILAIIALIATPVILGIIENARKESFKNSSLGVFKAAELYEAKNDFKHITIDGVNVTDSSLPLEHGNFTSGKIIRNESNEIELINVTDGTYCAKGTKNNLAVVKGTCDQFDTTAPVNTSITIDNITSNSFRVLVSSKDLESGIKNYQFSINGTDYITKTSNNHTFTNLTLNEAYTTYVRVTNNNNITSETVEKQVTTSDISVPSYSVDKSGWQTSKVVTISYPERKTGYIYEYSIDGGNDWILVETGTSSNITFDFNGNVIARIYDGTNYKTASSYSVTGIDTTAPSAGVTLYSKTTNSITVVASGTDSESGIIRYEFSIDGGSYINNGTNPTYTFNNVATGSHSIKVRTTNGSNLNAESSALEVSPEDIIAPTYSINATGWQMQKIVTITYPARQTGFVYQYSTNGGSSWNNVDSEITQTVTFNDNGSVIARIYDGTNYKTASSYSVTGIDTTAPIVTFSPNGSPSYVFNNDTDATFIDSESGIDESKSKYLWSTSTSAPSEGSFTLNAGDGEGIGMINASGAYYLWILIKDNAGNTTITRSNVFYIDVTTPTSSVALSSKTTNTITVIASGTDSESGITKYEFSIDGGSYINNGLSTTYTFTNVTTGSHSIKVRTTNGSGLTAESTALTVSPNEITTPVYSVDKTGWQQQKIVTITYPTRQTGFVYQYSINAGSTWTTVSSGTTQAVTFNSNGSVIARIYDGTNYKTASSYTVSQVDNLSPVISAKSSSYTITQDDSNVISSAYFNITYGASGGTTSCSAGGIAVSNTSTLAVGTHTVTCTATSGAGKTASASVSIIVKPKGIGVPNTTYALGQLVNYANINWRVVKDNGSSVTLLADKVGRSSFCILTYVSHWTDNLPGISATQTGTYTNIYSQTVLSSYLNSTWININSVLANDAANGFLINDGNGFVRLITTSEYSSLRSGTTTGTSWLYGSTIGAWYTMTAAPDIRTYGSVFGGYFTTNVYLIDSYGSTRYTYDCGNGETCVYTCSNGAMNIRPVITVKKAI